MAFEQRFGDHDLRDGGFTGSGFSADEQVERVLHAPVDRFAHIVHAQREHAWFRLAGEIPVRVDHGGERLRFASTMSYRFEPCSSPRGRMRP